MFFFHCLLIRLQFIIKTQQIFSYLYKLAAAYFFFFIFSFIHMNEDLVHNKIAIIIASRIKNDSDDENSKWFLLSIIIMKELIIYNKLLGKKKGIFL